AVLGNTEIVAVALERREGHASRLPCSARLGLVDEDAKQPRLEARSALEAVDPVENCEPGLLHHLFGDRARADEVLSEAQERRGVAVDEIRERTLVPAPQSGDEACVVELCLPRRRLNPLDLHGRNPRTTAEFGQGA